MFFLREMSWPALNLYWKYFVGMEKYLNNNSKQYLGNLEFC